MVKSPISFVYETYWCGMNGTDSKAFCGSKRFYPVLTKCDSNWIFILWGASIHLLENRLYFFGVIGSEQLAGPCFNLALSTKATTIMERHDRYRHLEVLLPTAQYKGCASHKVPRVQFFVIHETLCTQNAFCCTKCYITCQEMQNVKFILTKMYVVTILI